MDCYAFQRGRGKKRHLKHEMSGYCVYAMRTNWDCKNSPIQSIIITRMPALPKVKNI